MNESRVPPYAVHADGKICGFFGPFRFLSNFYVSKTGVWFEEMYFPTVEHAYQAAKWPVYFRYQFLDLSPGQAKKLGKEAPDFNAKKWNKQKVVIMASLIWQKFDRDRKLGDMLLMTEGCHLEERNSWGDVFWGTNQDGEGENHLGKILMDVRDRLKEKRLTEKRPVV